MRAVGGDDLRVHRRPGRRPLRGPRPRRVVAVANPLSEKYAVLRPSLLPGLVDAAAHNRRREHARRAAVRDRHAFSPPAKRRAVAGVWCGAGATAALVRRRRAADFYDVKGVVEALGRALGVELDFEPARCPTWLPGATASAGRKSSRLNGDKLRSAPFGLLGRSRRRFSMRADSRPAKSSTRSSSTSTRLQRLQSATTCAPNRCRASRRSCATCRCWSIAPCLRRRFVALSARRRLRRSRTRSSSIAIAARAFRTAASASRCASRSALRSGR